MNTKIILKISIVIVGCITLFILYPYIQTYIEIHLTQMKEEMGLIAFIPNIISIVLYAVICTILLLFPNFLNNEDNKTILRSFGSGAIILFICFAITSAGAYNYIGNIFLLGFCFFLSIFLAATKTDAFDI